MSIPVLDSQTSFHIPFHHLVAANSEVTIVKNKAILNRKFLILIVFVAIISCIFGTLPESSPNAFKKSLDIEGILLLVAVGLFLITTLYLGIKRLSRGLSNFNNRIGDCLYINNKPVAYLNADQKVSVVIQAVAGHKGIGTSYTVGVASAKKFWGLCYELDNVDASKVANFLGQHLGLDVERKEAAAFPLFKLH